MWSGMFSWQFVALCNSGMNEPFFAAHPASTTACELWRTP
jgi:hypothetical protein